VVTTQREGLERTILEIPHEGAKVFVEVLLEELDGNLVDTCGTSVATNGLEGLKHEGRVDLPRQGVGFWIFVRENHGEMSLYDE